MSGRPMRTRIEAARTPDPTLLRAAIAARVAGRPFPTRAEDEIAEKVARAVREHVERPRPRWR